MFLKGHRGALGALSEGSSFGRRPEEEGATATRLAPESEGTSDMGASLVGHSREGGGLARGRSSLTSSPGTAISLVSSCTLKMGGDRVGAALLRALGIGDVPAGFCRVGVIRCLESADRLRFARVAFSA